VEKILNKRIVWEKEKFWWKGYTAEEDTWENRENLGNMKELVEEFEREYGKRQKNLGNRSWKKKRRNLAENYLGSLQQNYYTGKAKGDMKGKERRDRTKIEVNGKIPWDKKS